MFKKLIGKKKKKHDKQLQNQNSNNSESNGSSMNGNGAPMINHTDSDHYGDDNMPPNPTNISKQSHSHDDMSADDIKKRQQKFAKKGGKKRHSHIGAMRHHQSSKNGKTKNGKSLHVPGDIKEEDEDNNNNNNNHQNGKTKNGTSNHSKNGSSTGSASTMMSSNATNKRLEQLMAMRAGKDAKGNRSRSVNVSKQKEKENKYPKKRRSEVHKEPRRHSMFPDKVK